MGDLTSILKDLNKKFGASAVQFYGDTEKVDVVRISTGLPSLDIAMGGGIPEGRILEVFGQESSGKSTLALKFLIEVQKAFPKKKVAYIDIEHALDPDYARNLGLKIDDVIISQPDSAEEALTIVESLAGSGEVKAIVIDSVAQLVPMKEVEGDSGQAEMGGRARLLGQSLRKLVPIAMKNLCTCFFINQMRDKIGVMFGPTFTTPGGKGLPYAASIRIKTSLKKVDELNGDVTMKIVKNKVGKPYQETTISIKYGTGFDYLSDLCNAGIRVGVIKEGASKHFEFGKRKFHGFAAMKEEVELSEDLQEELKEAIKMKIIELS